MALSLVISEVIPFNKQIRVFVRCINKILVRPQSPLETPIPLVLPAASRGSAVIVLTVKPEVTQKYIFETF